MQKKNIVSILVLVVIVAAPFIIKACPLCQGGGTSPETIRAYKGITLLLALLPVLGGGILFYWIYTKIKKIENN